MNPIFDNFESIEQDEQSFGIFGLGKNCLEPDYDYNMNPNFSYGSPDEFNEWKKEQQNQIQNNEFISTKGKTPLDYNPLWSKDEKEEEKDLSLALPYEQNSNPFLDHIQEIIPENDNQEKEIQNKAQAKVANPQPIKAQKGIFVSKEDKRSRIDYLFKKEKVAASEKMTKEANSRMAKLNHKFFKFSKPNSKEYTAVTKGEKNRAWLELPMKEIFTLGKDAKNGSLQKNNLNVIEKIEELEKDEKNASIKEFLEMTLEDFYIQIFFESEEFKKFCEDEEIKRLDEEFQRQKGYSIREKNALIKFINNY